MSYEAKWERDARWSPPPTERVGDPVPPLDGPGAFRGAPVVADEKPGEVNACVLFDSAVVRLDAGLPVGADYPTEQREDGRTIHPTAIVRESVVVGKGTAIWAYATIHEGVRLGAFVGVGELTYVGRNATIGDRTRISAQCYIVDHITIGSDVFIGPGAKTLNDRYPKANNPHYKRESPVIEDEVSIGGGAVILPGVRLGRGCLVGAGAVVTKDVPPYAKVVGNPARVTGRPPEPAP